MPLVGREPHDDTLVTHLGGAEITVRPEPPASHGKASAILLRLVSPMFDTLAVAYLGPAEARSLARALLAAADAADSTGPGGWRRPPWRA
ncbi:hypothetical protein I6A84_41410 [Frankia sp. CNm7]|uniref:Uncharacterized protein n=1 Tax=Frankia nepalensis TaxID=1836974 RepID=A0A937RWL7_9ACTN|nr:hypothetical protein [Frankia nepalensis]MBL7500752.1 hypothetical protein [Frankia nepalensis]MBL7511760.1 hypothetical protein [Frankia nepalensis]MBL7524329.1 hypothetical protein [Frankia nepalensis]MBL7633176.1 hypothetical protein [Frankia nepalensis]